MEKDNDNILEDYSRDASIWRGPLDVPFFILTLILLTIGVVMVLSASYVRTYYDVTKPNATYYFRRQLLFAVVGVAAMIVASRFPIGFYRKFSSLLMLASLAFLLLVLVGGKVVNGSRRWFELFGIQFQPSEIAKISLILFDAHLICRFRGKMATFKYGVLPFAGAFLILGIPMMLEPHFSATIILFLISIVMMFIGGTRLIWFLIGLIGAGGFGALLLLVTDYTKERIATWRDPFADTSDAGYQIVQSLYSIGSGGLKGLGLGNSRQKLLYLPEEHNDFIFSVICEELGFIGAALIIILFALLIIRGYWLAMHCSDRYSFLVCTGIVTLLAIQVFLNIAVVTNLIPCTGISLPFFSYGGTALLLQLAEMGIVLSISRDIPEKKPSRKKKNGAAAPEKA